MADGLFQRNPRNVRIASWVLAGTLFALWLRHDRKVAQEFPSSEIEKWNEDVLKKTGTKSEAQRTGGK